MSARREIKRIHVWSLGAYDSEGTFAGFVRGVVAALEGVPVEYRDAVVFRCDHGYGDDYHTWEAYYDRPETDDEMRKREAEERRYRDEREDRERATYEALKAKYESSQGNGQ